MFTLQNYILFFRFAIVFSFFFVNWIEAVTIHANS